MHESLEPPVKLCYYECPKNHVEGIADEGVITDQLQVCPVCEEPLEILETWESSLVLVMVDPEMNSDWRDEE
ncbi:MAG: hypothetical protein SVV03_02550 [Candidatus Nanohaloarchaea archaeon]|nr:hypothetical protein [Candidatus Nanohaloarchaea archaeon]